MHTPPERRHFSRNPKWGPSDFGCKKSGDGHGLRRPTFVLRPSRRALRAAPGLPQGLDAVSHGLAFRLLRRSRAALRRNARPYGYAGVVALRSSLTLPRFTCAPPWDFMCSYLKIYSLFRLKPKLRWIIFEQCLLARKRKKWDVRIIRRKNTDYVDSKSGGLSQPQGLASR